MDVRLLCVWHPLFFHLIVILFVGFKVYTYLYNVEGINRRRKHNNMYFLRFTSTSDETGFTSEDQVNKVQYDGLCAYDITDEVERMIADDYTDMEAFEICARLQAENDNWHAHNAKGNYVIFTGDVLGLDRDNMDRMGNRAVIAKLVTYRAEGQLRQTDLGYACVNIATR